MQREATLKMTTRVGLSKPIIQGAIVLMRSDSLCSVHGHNVLKGTGNGKATVDTEADIKKDPRAWKFNKSFHHIRYMIAFMGGISVGLMSLLRLNLTVAILNMVNLTEIYLEENPEGDLAEYFGETYEETGEFDWDNETQQLIISYYMIAYTLPQLTTTKLAIKIGAKRAMPLCLGLCALSSLLTPIFAYYGWQYVTILRLINGLGASAILPLMVQIIELWMPTGERSYGLAIVQSAQSILFTLSPLISGILCEIHWKWAFYAPALATLAFCLAWLALVSDGPQDCWLISEHELDVVCRCEEILERHLSIEADSEYASDTKSANCYYQNANASWTGALKERSFYGLVIVWICYNSSFGSFSFLAPSYMRQVLKVPIVENGMLCFTIHCGCMLSVIWPQPILELLHDKLKFSLTSSRRVVLALICIVAITTWLLVARYHEHQVILFSVNRFFHLSMDTIVTATIMSQYAKTGVGSIVYSVINSVGNLSTVLFCMAVGKFLDLSGQSVECWSWIFVAMSLLNVVVIILYSTIINSDPVKLGALREKDPADQLEAGSKVPTISNKVFHDPESSFA